VPSTAIRVCLLGTGSPAPLPHRQGAATLVSIGGQHLLFDAGRGVTTQLVRAGLAPEQLSAIFLTHHHYDHIGNLGDLMLTAWHAGIARLPIVGPPGTDAIVHALLDQVYQREIAFSLALARAVDSPLRDLRSLVDVALIGDGQSYAGDGWRVSAVDVEHGHGLGLSRAEWPCLGYLVEAADRRVVISGDTIASDALIGLASGADLLVHCCFRAEAAIQTHAQRVVAEQVIATSGQAGRVAALAQVKALALTHISDMAPELLESMLADVRRAYAGPIYLGEDLLTITL
jgi:ribonuclease BN (tRNA processing enzyme)